MSGQLIKSLVSNQPGPKGRRNAKVGNCFHDSVDQASPVAIDHSVNPWWDRRQSCWEVTGKVANDYTQLGPKIHEELNQACKEFVWPVSIWPYMVGESVQKARPCVAIASEDKTSGEDAKRAIERSEFLDQFPYFKLWPLRYLPSGPINPVAMEALDTVREVYFDPAGSISVTAMTVYVKHGQDSMRIATANGICNKTGFGYVTAAHAFIRNSVKLIPENPNERFEMPFTSDSESDCRSFKDKEEGLLSQYSESSSEVFRIDLAMGNSSSKSSPSSAGRNLSPQIHSSTTTLAGDHAADSVHDPMELDIPLIESIPIAGLELLGSMESLTLACDCAVIIVSNETVLSVLRSFEESGRGKSHSITAAKPRRAKIIAWTSRGPITGTLLNIPMYMRLPHNPRFETVYKFLCDENIKLGDCGTLVTDAASREIYGHVVAGSQDSRVALMMAAEEVMGHMWRHGNWQLLSSPVTLDTSCVQQQIVDTRMVATTTGPTEELPRIEPSESEFGTDRTYGLDSFVRQPLSVRETLRFLRNLPVYSNEKPFGVDDIPSGTHTNCKFEELRCDVFDIRGHLEPSIAAHGFMLHKHQSRCDLDPKQWEMATDSSPIVGRYLKETSDLVRELFQAVDVISLDWKVSSKARRGSISDEPAVSSSES
jgi:hypothetical protein